MDSHEGDTGVDPLPGERAGALPQAGAFITGSCVDAVLYSLVCSSHACCHVGTAAAQEWHSHFPAASGVM
jgi:hypothetical protein